MRTVFELAKNKEEKKEIEEIKKELLDLKELSKAEDLAKEIEERLEYLENKIKEKNLKIFLAEKYDRKNAILQIFAGTGGQDAQDWATMLLRMYQRYCNSKGWKTIILHQSFGQGIGPEGRIGTKSVTLEIKGDYAYGFLKKESGVHRLVRISPFSPQKLRHTSFALVEVLPELDKLEVKIKTEDLKIETFRSSGPGGQYVNKRESAVRITHLPSGIQVACQSERLQGLNKEKTLKILAAKLYQLKIKEREKEIKELKGNQISASWGNQIRNYILHPYKMVKDLRTKIEVFEIEDVLDGKLDKFIEAEIKNFLNNY